LNSDQNCILELHNCQPNNPEKRLDQEIYRTQTHSLDYKLQPAYKLNGRIYKTNSILLFSLEWYKYQHKLLYCKCHSSGIIQGNKKKFKPYDDILRGIISHIQSHIMVSVIKRQTFITCNLFSLQYIILAPIRI